MIMDKKKGLILSFITMFFWALHDVSFRFAAVEYSVEPTVFICFTLFVTAFVLIVVAGPGAGGMSTLKRGHTWAYGVLAVFLNIAQVFALIYITTTEMNFLNRATVVMSILATWMFFARRPHFSDLIGGSLVLGGLYFIAEGLDPAIRVQALVCILFVAFTSVATAMLGEIHPENNNAETIRARSRVAGYVLLVSSFVFLVMTLAVALLKENSTEIANALPIISGFPSLGDFLHKPTFFIALILGLTVMPIAMYFFFYATKTAKTETFMAVSSTLPFFTYAVEWLASKFGLLDISAITHKDLIAGAVIVAGAFLIEYMRYGNLKRKEIAVVAESTSDDFDMVNTALRFFDNNLTVVAEKLGVPVKDVEKVVEGAGGVSFDVSSKMYRTILRNYHRNIATVDPLTGLPNRDALTGAVEGALANKEEFSLVFIDLNKFKPINDTYGHEAGDTILKTVSVRLKNELSVGAVVSRIGGDEFVIMLRDVNRKQSEDLMLDITDIIAEDIYLETANVEVSVGASLGLAVAYEDGETLDELLKKADTEMYENKGDQAR